MPVVYIYPEDIQCNGNVSSDAVDREIRRTGINKEWVSQKLVSELHQVAKVACTDQISVGIGYDNVMTVMFVSK